MLYLWSEGGEGSQLLKILRKEDSNVNEGNLNHNELTELIHKMHKENQKAYSFFEQNRDWIVAAIKMDKDWFTTWKANNPPPPGVGI